MTDPFSWTNTGTSSKFFSWDDTPAPVHVENAPAKIAAKSAAKAPVKATVKAPVPAILPAVPPYPVSEDQFFVEPPPNIQRKVTSILPELLPLIKSCHDGFKFHRYLITLEDGDAALLHPFLLQYPDMSNLSDPIAHPSSISILKRYSSPESYSQYLSSYTSLWNILTHIMASEEFCSLSLSDLFSMAMQWLLQSRQPDQTAVIWSHMTFYKDINILPGDKFIKTWGMIFSMSRNYKPLKTKLQFRLILLPKFFVEIFSKFVSLQNSKYVPVDAAVEPIVIYTCLALTCGHHLEESYQFSWKVHIVQNHKSKSFQYNGICIHYPPFKRRTTDSYIPASQAFLILYDHVKNFYPTWLNEIPAAHILWTSSSSFATQISDYLVQYDDQTFPQEAMTHRILRRSYASYLHQLEMSAPALTAVLNHNSKKALASYVSQINMSGQDIISSHMLLFQKLKPPDVWIQFINAPKHFSFTGGTAKKAKFTDGYQPKIAGFLTTSRV